MSIAEIVLQEWMERHPGDRCHAKNQWGWQCDFPADHKGLLHIAHTGNWDAYQWPIDNS